MTKFPSAFHDSTSRKSIPYNVARLRARGRHSEDEDGEVSEGESEERSGAREEEKQVNFGGAFFQDDPSRVACATLRHIFHLLGLTVPLYTITCLLSPSYGLMARTKPTSKQKALIEKVFLSTWDPAGVKGARGGVAERACSKGRARRTDEGTGKKEGATFIEFQMK